MPASTYHPDVHRTHGARVQDTSPLVRIHVSCASCNRVTVYSWETIRHFRSDCPMLWLEQMLKPSCFDIVTELFRPECVREVVFLDASPEDVGCSDEG